MHVYTKTFTVYVLYMQLCIIIYICAMFNRYVTLMLPLQVWVQMLCDVVQVCCINVTELYKSGDILYCYPSTQQDCYRPATHHRHAAGLYNI